MLVITHHTVGQGANSYGQLGHGGVEDRSVPRLCNPAALKDKVVRVVTGGGGHTAVITGKTGPIFMHLNTGGLKSGLVDSRVLFLLFGWFIYFISLHIWACSSP